jgi:hypothetical protein
MALRQTKKISELPALSPASLDTTFVVGISGSTTYKISINNLTSSLDTTFATDLVTSALSNTLDTKLSTSSFNSYTASISTASLVTSISNLNIFTASASGTMYSLQDQLFSSSAITNTYISELLTTSSFNSYTASQSTSSLVNRLNAIENVSGSWITESETGSFLTSLSGAISSSSQLTTAFPSKTTGAWSAPAGASTQSFTVEAGASYTMWVNGNIPNGIITWNATVTTSNTNVPAVGSQYGWYYTPGNALVLTAMPDQIIGTNGSIANIPTSYAPNTSNVFKFGITNNSGTTQTINYGYIKLS